MLLEKMWMNFQEILGRGRFGTRNNPLDFGDKFGFRSRKITY